MCKILSLENKYSVKKINEKHIQHGKNKDDKGIYKKTLSTTYRCRNEPPTVFKANIPVTDREAGEPLYITGHPQSDSHQRIY